MENEHTYRVVAWWSSAKTGLAKSDSAPNAIHFAAPPQFGGLEGRWSPEDLLLCAIASCYTTTFRALAEYSKFEYHGPRGRGARRHPEGGLRLRVRRNHDPSEADYLQRRRAAAGSPLAGENKKPMPGFPRTLRYADI